MTGVVQGHLAHQKHPRLGPHSGTRRRVLWWSWGGGAVSYEQGAPASLAGGVGDDEDDGQLQGQNPVAQNVPTPGTVSLNGLARHLRSLLS